MSFRISLAVCFLVAALAPARAQEKYRVYLGTYTGKESKGIYQCEMNLKDGSLSAATLAGETSSPSFLAIHPNKKFLYAVNEGQATVSAFAIDDKTGNLTFLNSQPSQGGAPCHLVVDPTGKNVLAANYIGRKLHLHPHRSGRQARQGHLVPAARGPRERTGIRSTSTRPTSSPSAATWAWTRSSFTPSTPARER